MAIVTTNRLATARATREGIIRTQAHARRAITSYWKSLTNPTLLSEAAAQELTEVERLLSNLQRALDRVQIQLLDDENNLLNK